MSAPTKEEHDLIVSVRGRPFTDSMRLRHADEYTPKSGESPLDAYAVDV